jgi:undecaprenyl-diphosphatase
MTVLQQAPARRSVGEALKGWVKRIGRPERAAAKRVRRFERKHMWAGVAAFLMLLLLLLVFADAAAIVAARQLPVSVNRFFNFITDFGKSGWVLWPLGLLLLLAIPYCAMANDRAKVMIAHMSVRLLYLFTAIALPGIFINIIKGFIGRARPFVGGAPDPYLFKVWTWVPAYASFPSGHSTAAASIAFAFGAVWPRLRIPLWIYAAFIVVSRVVVTAHHPSDVMGGVFFGVAGAWLVRHYFATRALGFAVDQAGRIYPSAWPSWGRFKRVAARGFAQ